MAAWPVFGYGFRPFFLACGAFATIVVPAWMMLYARHQALWPNLPTQLWHAHEMLYGFAAAAIAGFLLTAVPSWTGIRGFAGRPLVALSLTWCAARVLIAIGPGSSWWLAIPVELAFLPGLALLIGPPIVRERNRNMIMLAVLAALWIADATWLYAISTLDLALASRALLVTLDIVLLLVTIIGGRIVPSFTANALRRAGQGVDLRSYPLVERVLPPLMMANVLADALVPGSRVVAAVAAAAAVLQAWRLSGWRSLRTRGEPILWVLHVGYAWLPLGFALKAWALAGGATIAQFWQHAFGIGAVATMILAVMTRAALGHSGRPLTVARGIAWAYGLLSLSALARVLLPHLGWLDYATSLLVAALLWTAAFTLFVAYYGPILTTPRIDGKPG